MKKRAIKMVPREVLTVKARAAIVLYSRLRADGRRGRHTLDAVVGYALEAERMSRARLYGELAQRGYVWKSGAWYRSARPVKPPTSKPSKAKSASAPKHPAAEIPDDPALILELIRNGQVPVRAAKSLY